MAPKNLFVSAGGSEPGGERQNEDAFVIHDESQLYVVADGVGSRPYAADASRLASEEIARHYMRLMQTDSEARSMQRSLSAAVQAANQSLLSAGESDSRRSGMATVVSALAFRDSAACVVHVGDTRVYLLRGGSFILLTTDHTSAYLLAKSSNRDYLRTHPLRKHLLRALGLESVLEVEVTKLQVEPGDRFLLCSDGLTEVADEVEIKNLLESPDHPSVLVLRMLSLAKARDAKDDVTTVVVDVVE